MTRHPVERGGSPRRVRSLPAARDMDATAFTMLLAELIGRVPGARGAALVDRDGESIDYAGSVSPFDVKVAAAHWQIVLHEIERVPLFQGARQVTVRGRDKSFLLRVLDDGYAVVVVLSARAGFSHASRAFAVFERALKVEAGIGRAQPGPSWTPVIVQCDGRTRPQNVAAGPREGAHTLEVLGSVMGLCRGERGFRVRTHSGIETTLIREPGGSWYADEPIGPVPEQRRSHDRRPDEAKSPANPG